MTVWVLHCWALDLPDNDAVSWHFTFEDACYTALAWTEAEKQLPRRWRGTYSLCEVTGNEDFAVSPTVAGLYPPPPAAESR